MSTQRGSHLERTAQEPRDESLLDVRLERVDQVNERIRLYRLKLESGPTKFLAGQWLDTYIPGNPKPGGFTLTSTPRAAADPKSPYLELAVQESPENPPAAWLWQSPSDITGAKLQVRVGGSFVFPPSEIPVTDISHVVFVAGGVGINPLVSMMGHIAEEGYNLEVKVLYASKLPAQGLKGVLFLERIRKWFTEKELIGDLKFFTTGIYDGQVESRELDVHERRFTVEDVKEAVDEKNNSVVYVCGPATMTDEIVDGLTGGNAKLKVFSNYHPSMWKLIVTYAPLLGAVLIGGALTIDKYHHFHDVLAGAIIGTVFAFSAYRMTYAAVWDWRFNHIPLNRGAPFNYSMGGAELVDAVFTRKVGWGSHGGSSLGHGHGHGLKSDGSEHMHGDGYHNGSIPRRPVGTGARGEEMV